MDALLQFSLLGLGAGAIYVLAAQGLVLIYRGSGTINFAHGAMALMAAAVFVELHHDLGLPLIVAAALGVFCSGLTGYLVDTFIMCRIRQSSPLARMVVTLGVLAVIESIVVMRYGSGLRFVEHFLPQQRIAITREAGISADRLLLCGIAVITTTILWSVYRFTEFGRQTTAVAENQRTAAAMGISAQKISRLNWVIGSALAGLAGVLFVPLSGLMPVIFVLLIIPMLAAALVGGFTSFPLTLLGGLAIGVIQSLVSYSGAGTGWPETIPLLLIVIVIVLVFRGQVLPQRGYIKDVLPAVRDAAPIGSSAVMLGLIALAAILFGSVDLVNALSTSLISATIALSVVVLTGYTGQLSLGQFAFVGMGALIAARLADIYNIPFLVAAIAGVVFTVPLGLLFAIPALRTRGINLGIVTLGLGFALDSLVFKNKELTGGFEGTEVSPPMIFGLSLDAIAHPQRFAMLCLLLFLICAWQISNIRRGISGRRLLAVRANERAAAALGVSVTGAKLYAFALAAGIAAAAGALQAFRYPNVRFDVGYSNFESIPIVLMSFMGGVGHIGGAMFAGLLAMGGVINELLSEVVDLSEWQGMVIGIGAIYVVLMYPNGLAARSSFANNAIARGREKVEAVASQTTAAVSPQALVIDQLSLRYGGTVALSGVSFRVEPGTVLGLIGPNGAGKTSLIDCVTGFSRAQQGSVFLGGKKLDLLSPVQRARAGLGRSFQSLELFADLSVADNIRVAADYRDSGAYFRELFAPRISTFTADAVKAITLFGLEPVLGMRPDQLSFGQRRLLGMARAVAVAPSAILLDEPAAGLSSAESAELGKLIRWLADERGMAVLLVEHDMALVMSVCDRIVALDFGRKIFEGSPTEAQRNAAVLAAYLGDDE